MLRELKALIQNQLEEAEVSAQLSFVLEIWVLITGHQCHSPEITCLGDEFKA